MRILDGIRSSLRVHCSSGWGREATYAVRYLFPYFRAEPFSLSQKGTF